MLLSDDDVVELIRHFRNSVEAFGAGDLRVSLGEI
jgi:hypothetical protein